MKRSYALLNFLALLTLLWSTGSIARAQVPTPPAQPQTGDAALLSRLNREAGGQVRIIYHPETGKVRAIIPAAQRSIPPATTLAANPSSEQASRSFLTAYGPLFGVADQRDLSVMREVSEGGRSFVRFQQHYKGIPVLAGELIVQTGNGGDVFSASGEALPDLATDVVPTVDAGDASRRARELVARTYDLDANTLQISQPELWLYNPLLLGAPGVRVTTLNWRVEVRSLDSSTPVRELVLVDAQRGDINLHFNQIADAKKRRVCNDKNVVDKDGDETNNCPASKAVRKEGQKATGVADVDLAYDYAGATYDFYKQNFNRDSLNNKGLELVSLVKYCPDKTNCPYNNAFWDGQQMTYGDGYASADDVVGHELSHGFTEFTSGLFYYFQAGAINEALSDIFGEAIDQTDGLGNDTNDVRWALGEDLPESIGVIRYMADPPVFGQPDRMGSSLYAPDPTLNDNGGVHTNSGIANKAFFLMVDGGAFNNVTVNGIGIAKAIQIFYRVNNTLLISGSDYADLAAALQIACTSLVGTAGITAADCGEVTKAIQATEMTQVAPNAPAADVPVCQTGQTLSDVFFDDLENTKSGNWVSKATVGTTNLWYYPPPADLLGGRYTTSGNNSFFGLDAIGKVADSNIAMTKDVTLPQQAVMHFRHAYDFGRAGKTRFSGGVVEYSTDSGSTWNDAAPLFTFNGYNSTIETKNDNPLGGRKAFGGLSYGYLSSRLDLSSLAGQHVRFRFRIGTEADNSSVGWFIDDIRIATCAGTVADSTPTATKTGNISIVAGGATITETVAQVSDVEDTVGKLQVSVANTPAGIDIQLTNDNGIISATATGECTIAPGAYDVTLNVSDSGNLVGSTTFTIQVAPAGEQIKDTSFEEGDPNPYWDATVFGTGALLCDTGGCAVDNTAGPRTGNWWARFGGPLNTDSDGHVQQTVDLTSGTAASLEFYAWLGVHSGSGTSDYVRVLVDGTELLRITDADTQYDAGYTKVTLDLSAFAGGTHTLRFEEHNQASANRFRLHVDDVSVISTPNACSNVQPNPAPSTSIYLPSVRR